MVLDHLVVDDFLLSLSFIMWDLPTNIQSVRSMTRKRDSLVVVASQPLDPAFDYQLWRAPLSVWAPHITRCSHYQYGLFALLYAPTVSVSSSHNSMLPL